MPLTNSINLSNDLQILIWNIEESLEVLEKNLKLSEADKVRFQKRKITAHQKEFLASRRLLMEAGVSPVAFGSRFLAQFIFATTRLILSRFFRVSVQRY